MKIIIRQFQRQTLGGLRGGVTEFRKRKPEAAKGSQLFWENSGSAMSRGIKRQNLITAWSQAEVGKRALRFCERCKLWKQTHNSSEWCMLGSTAVHHFCSPLWSLRGCPGLEQETAASLFRNDWNKPEISQLRCFQEHTHRAARPRHLATVKVRFTTWLQSMDFKERTGTSHREHQPYHKGFAYHKKTCPRY